MTAIVGYGLADALHRVADLHGDEVAVRCGEEVWTFSQLRDRVARLAAAWRQAGVAPGDRVAVLADNCHRFAETYWACAYTGAVCVPVERRLSGDEIRGLLEQVAPAALVGGTAAQLDTLRRAAPGAARLEVVLAGAPGPTRSHDDLLATGSGADGATPVDPDAPVAVFFTAAVEGRPRGAVITQRNFVAQAVQTSVGLGIGPGDRQGMFLPLAHTFGGYLMFVASCSGVATTILAEFDPVAAARLVAAGNVTFFAGFAPMPARLADAAAEAGLTFPGGLRMVIGLDGPPTISRYLGLGVRWMNFYGQTETSGLVAVGEVTADRVDPTAVGRPLALSRLSLRDEAGTPVPAGEAGEAWVRSDVAVARYWPDEPTRLSDDGWLRTGDVLAAGPGFGLRFIGRTSDKDLVKPGGLNVYPAEVEQLLAAHPGVAAAFVFGLPDPEWHERVCAVVVAADPASPPGAEELRAHCQERAARFKTPRSILVLTEAPEGLTRATANEHYASELEAGPVADAG